jgi:hypothetical protein
VPPFSSTLFPLHHHSRWTKILTFCCGDAFLAFLTFLTFLRSQSSLSGSDWNDQQNCCGRHLCDPSHHSTTRLLVHWFVHSFFLYMSSFYIYHFIWFPYRFIYNFIFILIDVNNVKKAHTKHIHTISTHELKDEMFVCWNQICVDWVSFGLIFFHIQDFILRFWRFFKSLCWLDSFVRNQRI